MTSTPRSYVFLRLQVLWADTSEPLEESATEALNMAFEVWDLSGLSNTVGYMLASLKTMCVPSGC